MFFSVYTGIFYTYEDTHYICQPTVTAFQEAMQFTKENEEDVVQ